MKIRYVPQKITAANLFIDLAWLSIFVIGMSPSENFLNLIIFLSLLILVIFRLRAYQIALSIAIVAACLSILLAIPALKELISFLGIQILGSIVFILALCLTKLVKKTFSFGITNEITSLTGALIFAAIYVKNSAEDSLGFLTKTGEDNAAWIVQFSNYLGESGQKRFSSDIFDSAGTPSGVINVLVLFTQSFGNPSGLELVDAPVLVIKTYFFISTIFCWILFLSLGNTLKNYSKQNFNLTLAQVIGIYIFYLFSFAVLANGHLTFWFSTILVLTGIFVVLTKSYNVNLNIDKERNLLYFISIIFIISGTIAWPPLRPVGYIFIAVQILFLLKEFRFFKNFLVASASILVVFAFIYIDRLEDWVNEKNNSLSTLVHAQGGTSDGLGLLGILSLVSIIYFVNETKPHFDSNFLRHSVGILFLGLLAYFFFIYTYSTITPPYTIDYAAKKLSLLVAFIGMMIAIPIFVIRILTAVISTSNKLVIVFAFLIGLQFLIPGPKFTYLNSIKSENPAWVKPVIREIQENPNRLIICINTKEGLSSFDLETYFCNRFATAIFTTNNPQNESWAMKGLREDFSDLSDLNLSQDYSSFSVYLNDSSRRSTDNKSQGDYLGKFPWEEVKIISSK